MQHLSIIQFILLSYVLFCSQRADLNSAQKKHKQAVTIYLEEKEVQLRNKNFLETELQHEKRKLEETTKLHRQNLSELETRYSQLELSTANEKEQLNSSLKSLESLHAAALNKIYLEQKNSENETNTKIQALMVAHKEEMDHLHELGVEREIAQKREAMEAQAKAVTSAVESALHSERSKAEISYNFSLESAINAVRLEKETEIAHIKSVERSSMEVEIERMRSTHIEAMKKYDKEMIDERANYQNSFDNLYSDLRKITSEKQSMEIDFEKKIMENESSLKEREAELYAKLHTAKLELLESRRESRTEIEEIEAAAKAKLLQQSDSSWASEQVLKKEFASTSANFLNELLEKDKYHHEVVQELQQKHTIYIDSLVSKHQKSLADNQERIEANAENINRIERIELEAEIEKLNEQLKITKVESTRKYAQAEQIIADLQKNAIESAHKSALRLQNALMEAAEREEQQAAVSQRIHAKHLCELDEQTARLQSIHEESLISMRKELEDEKRRAVRNALHVEKQKYETDLHDALSEITTLQKMSTVTSSELDDSRKEIADLEEEKANILKDLDSTALKYNKTLKSLESSHEADLLAKDDLRAQIVKSEVQKVLESAHKKMASSEAILSIEMDTLRTELKTVRNIHKEEIEKRQKKMDVMTVRVAEVSFLCVFFSSKFYQFKDFLH